MEMKIPLELTPPAAASRSSITVALVAMLPVILFVGGTVARVAYLQVSLARLMLTCCHVW
jgi:hypothetical protein